ncbi:hypothetical protein GGI35DRAFT_71967 [Trichoderma velutinum]
MAGNKRPASVQGAETRKKRRKRSSKNGAQKEPVMGSKGAATAAKKPSERTRKRKKAKGKKPIQRAETNEESEQSEETSEVLNDKQDEEVIVTPGSVCSEDDDMSSFAGFGDDSDVDVSDSCDKELPDAPTEASDNPELRRITKEQWCAGYPVPRSQLPEGMTIHQRFEAQPLVAMSEADLAAAVKKWQNGHKNRPQFAQLLRFDALQNNRKLLAGYLGFSTVPELLHFADFIVPQTIQPLIEIYSRHSGKSTQKLPQASKL